MLSTSKIPTGERCLAAAACATILDAVDAGLLSEKFPPQLASQIDQYRAGSQSWLSMRPGHFGKALRASAVFLDVLAAETPGASRGSARAIFGTVSGTAATESVLLAGGDDSFDSLTDMGFFVRVRDVRNRTRRFAIGRFEAGVEVPDPWSEINNPTKRRSPAYIQLQERAAKAFAKREKAAEDSAAHEADMEENGFLAEIRRDDDTETRLSKLAARFETPPAPPSGDDVEDSPAPEEHPVTEPE